MKQSIYGFTLLEILVALAVLGLAMGATLQLASASAMGLAQLQTRSWGQWLASNTLYEALLSADPPELGTTTRRISFGGRAWAVETLVESVTDLSAANLRRVTVNIVATEPENELVAQGVGLWGAR